MTTARPQNHHPANAGAVKIIAPRNTLREKLGQGGLDKRVIDRADQYLKSSPVDFAPMANIFLNRLQQAIARGRDPATAGTVSINDMILPAMELKANGGMFRYELVTSIANILMNFLEGLDRLNSDALDVVDVHYKTLHAMVAARKTGTGGAEGQKLCLELQNVCRRYVRKYNALPKH